MKKDSQWSIGSREKGLEINSSQELNDTMPFPKNIMIELSNACNHSCIFCTNPKMTRKKTLIDGVILSNILSQAKQLGSDEVGFYTTGDPLIHKNLCEFVKQAKTIGYSYTYISTNGGLATEEKIKELLDAGLDSIKFSINAGTRKTYEIVHGKDDWEKVVNIVRFTDEYRKSQKLDCKLAITYVVLSCNKDEIPYLREACGAFVDDIHINKVASNQAGYMLENKEYISMDFPPQASSQAPCFMLFNRAHVSCEGYLTLCCVDYQNYLALADLKTTPLSEAWNNLIFQEMRRRHLSNNLVGTLCHNCINNCMTEIQPLVKAYASDFDFAANHEKNLTKQKNRFHYSESS